jgi:hypothetical protein
MNDGDVAHTRVGIRRQNSRMPAFTGNHWADVGAVCTKGHIPDAGGRARSRSW